jgi:hypothetical protein
MTIAGWIAVALLSQNYGSSFPVISIQRGTTGYHGIMALMLLIGYAILIVRNLKGKTLHKVNILWLLAIGIGVQFSWEFVLLISNIRPAGFLPLVVNSLIETNLGMPYLYLMHEAINTRFDEGLQTHSS